MRCVISVLIRIESYSSGNSVLSPINKSFDDMVDGPTQAMRFTWYKHVIGATTNDLACAKALRSHFYTLFPATSPCVAFCFPCTTRVLFGSRPYLVVPLHPAAITKGPSKASCRYPLYIYTTRDFRSQFLHYWHIGLSCRMPAPFGDTVPLAVGLNCGSGAGFPQRSKHNVIRWRRLRGSLFKCWPFNRLH